MNHRTDATDPWQQVVDRARSTYAMAPPTAAGVAALAITRARQRGAESPDLFQATVSITPWAALVAAGLALATFWWGSDAIATWMDPLSFTTAVVGGAP